jgi:hydroxylamine reductase (hybrid-cluster protein)
MIYNSFFIDIDDDRELKKQAELVQKQSKQEKRNTKEEIKQEVKKEIEQEIKKNRSMIQKNAKKSYLRLNYRK